MLLTNTKQYRNAMIGLASGDAWGYQVEFTTFNKMRAPVRQPAGVWKVSDDTQMTLAVEDALFCYSDVHSNTTVNVEMLSEVLLEAFCSWSLSPDNDRAPGATCMGSIAAQSRNGTVWYDSKNGAIESAGCGAVMRALPAIAMPETTWRAVTALQALVTHKHPMAVASALLLGEVARRVYAGDRDVLDISLDAADDLAAGNVDLDENLIKVLGYVTDEPVSYLAEGASGLLVDSVFSAVEWWDKPAKDFSVDICSIAGEGWDSATAVALSVLASNAYLQGELTADEALAWAVSSNGDSDSIGAISGMIIGMSSGRSDFWSAHSVRPQFEDAYNSRIFSGFKDFIYL